AEVIANDLDEEHLERLAVEALSEGVKRPTTIRGRFPTDFDLPNESLSAVHASNVLHFLKGEDIEAGAKKIFGWLEPGGKVFTISATPYAVNIKGFIQTYEARRAAGLRWPGECEQISAFSEDPTIKELPDFMNLLDDTVLARSFRDAGFDVEESRLFFRRDTPDYIRFDGRENVRMIAVKPGGR
ncbi:MAG: class I SAM-dependent methyltransferase, partial [Geminicoccaceae bacterium]